MALATALTAASQAGLDFPRPPRLRRQSGQARFE